MKGIIVVDDSRTIRKQMTLHVKKVSEDLKVFDFESGEQALSNIDNIDTDIVMAFLDYNMEGMTGVDLATELLKKIPSQQIALVTANIQDAIREKASNLNIRFVEKPITLEKIKELIGLYL